MKNTIFNSATLLVIFALLFTFTACEEDPIITGSGSGDGESPSISFVDSEGFLVKDADLEVGEAFSVRLSILAGTDDLSSLTIFEDGVKLDASRITIAGIDAANNPQLIVNKTGAEFDVTIAADASITEGGIYTYAFEVEDAGKLTDVVSLTIITSVPVDPTTPLDQTLTGILLNQAGPADTGGLDLDTGDSVGSNAAEAEIQDEGIDLDKGPDANWRRQIAGANGAVVRTVDLNTVAENLTFDKVENKEQVLAAFETGSALSGTDDLQNPSDNTAQEAVSEPVQIGDVFAVQSAAGKNYLLICTDVNVTTDSNGDSYTFSVKY